MTSGRARRVADSAAESLRRGRIPGVALLRVTAVMLAVRAALWCLPYDSLRKRLDRRRLRLERAARERRGNPAVIASRVALAARLVPQSTCLVQALVGEQLLAAAGYEPVFQLGVRAGADVPFAAHAWVEVDGRVLIGGEISAYSVIGPTASVTRPG